MLRPAFIGALFLLISTFTGVSFAATNQLPRVRISGDGRGFVTEEGKPYVPFGVNYFRPHTGWAPQVWKKFDADATRADFAGMKKMGVNCVRVFLSFGSFYQEPGKLMGDGMQKFDQFLAAAEVEGIYVHPTGPDHWEGLPEWARADRYADEPFLKALEQFWALFAAKYKGRHVIFAYDLLNEPHVPWDTPAMRTKWNSWLERKYRSKAEIALAWGLSSLTNEFPHFTAPPAIAAPGSQELLDYQLFREEIADDWTRRQVAAIKSADPNALVTVGLIQWAVPSLVLGVQHYAATRPSRQAQFLDFMEVHFYPLDSGAFEYRDAEDENRNLAYAHSVVAEVAKVGKPVILAEFGWYGGGKPRFDGGKHPAASEAQQARWCRRLIETTTGVACGWLNWGLYDSPEATDPSEFTGLLTSAGEVKEWGREFERLARVYTLGLPATPERKITLRLDWDRFITDPAAANPWRKQYQAEFLQNP